jgi:hypothetical protein
MTMLRRMIVLAFGAVSLLSAEEAFSANLTIGGSQCHLSFNSPGTVSYFDGTIFSTSSTVQFVDCPLATMQPTLAVRVHYLDSSSAANFRCYGYFRKLDGTPAFTPSLFSCAAVGGCTTNVDPSFSSPNQGQLFFTQVRGFSGVTCELPPGGQIRFLEIVP